MHVVLALINKLLSKQNSGSTGPIFTKFSPYGRYLIVNLILIAQGTLPWQPILGSNLAKSTYAHLYSSP